MSAPVSAALAANVTLTSANTFYNGPSLTIERGRWLITAHVTVRDTGASGARFTAKLSDGTTDFVSTEQTTHNTNAGTFGNEAVTMRLSWHVSPAVTTTYTIKVASTVASTGSILATAPHNAAAADASVITACLASFLNHTSTLAADVSLSTADTYFDGPTVTLEAGTWLLTGTVTLLDTAGGSRFTAFLVTTGDVFAGSEEWSQGANEPVSISLSSVVTPSSTTTYRLEVAASGGSTSGKIKAAAPDNGAGNNASSLAAVLVGGGSNDSVGPGNVSLTADNTYANGPSLTLAAGSWLLIGQLTFGNNFLADDYTAQLWNGSSELATGEAQTQTDTESVSVPVIAIVALGASTTIRLRGAAVDHVGATILHEPLNDSVSNQSASWLCAVAINTVQVYDIVMLAADCKVLSLWNGSSNNAPPTGWEGVSFDDSGWATAVSPTPSPTNSYGRDSWSTGTWLDLPEGLGTTATLPPHGCQPVSTTIATTGNGSAQFLIRWRFFLPDLDYDRLDSAIWTAGVNHGGTTGMASDVAVSINGNIQVFVFGNLGFPTSDAMSGYGNPGAINLITHRVNTPFPSVDAWIGGMWETLFFRFSNSTGPVLPLPAATAGRRAWAAVVG